MAEAEGFEKPRPDIESLLLGLLCLMIRAIREIRGAATNAISKPLSSETAMRATTYWIASVGLVLGICVGCGSTVTTPPTTVSGGKTPPVTQPPMIHSEAPATNGAAQPAETGKSDVPSKATETPGEAKPSETKQPSEPASSDPKTEAGEAKPDEAKPDESKP